MKYFSKILLTLFVFFLSFNYVNALECCYTGSDVTPVADGNCVGENSVSLNLGYDACLELSTQRLSCYDGSLTRCDVEGEFIYDNPIIKSRFPQCSFSTYDSNVCVTGETGGTGSGDGEPGDGNGEDDPNPQDPGEDTEEITELNLKCTNGGGFLSLFGSKDSCESINLPGDNFCVYNSYLGGEVKSYFANGGSFDLFEREKDSCVLNKVLKSCNDLKNENLCENHNLDNLMDKSGNENSCMWVENKDFANFSYQNGICVSKLITNQTQYDSDYFFLRGNLNKINLIDKLQLGDVGYLSPGSAILNKTNNKVLKYLELVSPDYTYDLSFAVKNVGNFLNGTLVVSVGDYSSPFNNVNYEKKHKTFRFPLRAVFNETNYNIFKPLSVDVKPKVQYSYDRLDHNYKGYSLAEGQFFEFSLETEDPNVSVIVNAISFKVAEGENPLSSGTDIYNHYEVIPSKASSCEKCFDDLGFNLCTQEKSDLLGDCSYMVENSSTYYGQKWIEENVNPLGRVDNYLAQDKWKSQSVANSLLFCEVYDNEQDCLNVSKYVTKTFGVSCGWRNDVGCFKDNNWDGDFDTIDNVPKLVSNSQYHYRHGDPQFYAFESGTGTKLGVSDFALACDVAKPNVYAYLSGKNIFGDYVLVGENDNGALLGNVMFNIEASDIILESCSKFDFNKMLYIEYIFKDSNDASNFKYYVEEISSNQFISGQVDVNEYFVRNGIDYLQGHDILELRVLDQSGNIGREYSFDLNFDNLAPSINLTNYPNVNGFVPGIFGANTKFNFTVTDKAGIDSCRYELKSDSADISFYQPVGNISLNFSNGNNDVDFTFGLPITNSSEDGDVYELFMTCEDIFGQEQTNGYVFKVDVSTQLVLIKPFGFVDKNFDLGFLSNQSSVVLTSSDVLNSCRFENFDNLSSNSILNIFTYDPLVHNGTLDGIGDVDVVSIVLGNIDFTSDGIYTGQFVCDDFNGNSFSINETYYYDTENPVMNNFSIIGNSNEVYYDEILNTTYVVGQNSNFFSIGFNLSLDGTGTWINRDVKVNYELSNGDLLEIGSVMSNYLSELQNDSFKADLQVKFSIDTLIMSGINASEDGSLKNYTFMINVSDKAGNNEVFNVSFILDNSDPILDIGGEVIDVNPFDNLIFTKFDNPLIVVNLGNNSYRKLSCEVSTSRNGVMNPTTYVENDTRNVKFKLSPQLDTLEWFKKYKELDMNFDCVDMFGNKYQKDVTLHYDNTPLILNSVELVNGPEYYSKLASNYEGLIDGLKFKFNDTNEIGGYFCSYSFRNVDSYYGCKPEVYNIPSFTGLDYTSPAISMVSPRNGFTTEFICSRTPDFYTAEVNSFNLKSDLSTKLALDVKCTDAMNNEVTQSIDITYDYLSGGLIDFEIVSVSNDKVRFVVKSLVDYGNINISRFNDGTNSIMSLTSSRNENGIFIFESIDYDISNLAEGEQTIYAVAFDSGYFDGFLIDKLFVDHRDPIVNISVRDLNEKNEIYYDTFKINLDAFDAVSGLEVVYFYLDGQILGNFTPSNLNVTSTNYSVVLSDLTSNYFYNLNKNFDANVLFGKGTLDESYTFKVEAFDRAGRSASSEITIKYVDGLIVELLDSSNALVFDYGYGWITRSSAPIIKFNTSKFVTCDLDIGGFIFSDGPNNNFEFDLSSQVGFDLNNLSDDLKVKFSCDHVSAGNFKLDRDLVLNNMLLDYVLIPQNGFYVTEENKLLNFNVKSVTPFSRINCEYSVNGIETFDMGTLGPNGGIGIINVSNFVLDGPMEVELYCEDPLGNYGPKKKYIFDVDLTSDLILDKGSLEFVSGNGKTFNYDEDLDVYYIYGTRNVFMSFELNKRFATCSYGVDPVNNILSGVVNFFRDLFDVERVNFAQTTPYEFATSGLNFADGQNDLVVECSDDLGNSLKETFDVRFVNRKVDLGITRTAE